MNLKLPETVGAMSAITIQERVHYPDCDPMGYVHHGVYPLWFERARTELLRQSGRTYADMEAAGSLLVVTDLQLKYLKPARYDELVQITATVSRMTAVRIEHVYEVRRGNDLLCTGTSTLAHIDRSGRPRPLPEGFDVPGVTAH